MWLPRGFQLRLWAGGAVMPQRPPTLMRPTPPSWALAGRRPVDVRPMPGVAPARPRLPTGAAICRLTIERAAKRAREDDTARSKVLDSFARFLETCSAHSGLAALMVAELGGAACPVILVSDCASVVRSFAVGAEVADHFKSPHAGIWRDIDRSRITDIIKVKAHLSEAHANAAGHGEHWRGNFLVDLLAKDAAKGYADTEAQGKVFFPR